MTDLEKKIDVCYFVLSGPPLIVYLSSYFKQKSNQGRPGQTSLPLITWGGGDGCDRRGNDAAGVEGSKLLHLNRRHRGNRREVGWLRHQGLLLHQLEDEEVERRERKSRKRKIGGKEQSHIHIEPDSSHKNRTHLVELQWLRSEPQSGVNIYEGHISGYCNVTQANRPWWPVFADQCRCFIVSTVSH